MFTGIIQLLGRVQSVARAAGGVRLTIVPDPPIEDVETGESIAINGVCLTVEPGSHPEHIAFFISAETLSKSNLGKLASGDFANLERALRVGDRLGGHFVMGHVDCVGTLRRLDRSGEAWDLEIEFPPTFRRYLAPKGSVAIEGISLTVVDVKERSFTVAIIPHTYKATALRARSPGSSVNLEADVLARYAVHCGDGEAGGVTPELLQRAGFE